MAAHCDLCGVFPAGDPGAKPRASERFGARVESTRRIIPGPGLPETLEPGFSNNNLDVVRHAGRVFLAWRSAPDHYASGEARVRILSSVDERTWNCEHTLDEDLGRDVREPRLLSLGDRLILYVSTLGTDPTAFEPNEVVWTERRADGTWTAAEALSSDQRVVWRTKARTGVDGVSRGWMSFYRGGEEIYRPISEFAKEGVIGSLAQLVIPVALRAGVVSIGLARSADGLTWEDEVELNVGGASETAFDFLPDGRVVAVARSELPEEGQAGSLLLLSRDPELRVWDKKRVPQKFDSPLMFPWRGELFLIARRTLAHGGHYMMSDEVDSVGEYVRMQQRYACSYKRTALWHVRTDRIPSGGLNLANALALEWVTDLPSRGDTCFPGILGPSEHGELVVYDYSAPLNGSEEPRWCDAQAHLTHIYRHEVRLEEVVR